MPTYYSLGVSATLSVAELDASLSTVVELKGGEEQRKDARRIEDIMANGRVLPEKPLSPPGQKGPQQFLGANQDMPFTMVLAGESLKGTFKSNRSASASESVEAAAAAAMVMLAMGQKHQHSYGTRSTQKSTTETPRPTRGASGKERGGDLELPHSYPYGMRSIQQPPSSLRTAAAPQALCLTIETSNESFLPTTDRSGRSSSDKKARSDKALKVEVFVNGQLAGVSFVNRRGSAVEYSNNKVRFQGTRIHRQSEKPWIYTGNAKMQVGEDGNDDTNDSLFVEQASKGNERWTKINAALEEEASARGRNDAGEMPPSAEFLQALSELKVPQSVAGNEGIGIIDVIVTVGTGKKYGPEHGYLSEPSRMDDNTYSTLNPAPDPVANDFTFLGQDAEDASPLFDPGNRGITSAYTGYPITPARRRRDSGASVGDTPSKKTKTTPAELAKKFGLEGVDLKQMLDGYETSMGKAGVPKRNLSQRLTDLAKMNPKNQEKQQARLNMAQAAGLNSNSRLHQRIVSNTPAHSSHQGGGMMQGFGSGPTAHGPYNHPAQATAPTASAHAPYNYQGQGTAPAGSANVRYSYQGPGVMSTMPARPSSNYPGQGTAPTASAGIPLVYQYQGPGLMSTMPGHRSYNNSGQGTAPTASTYGSNNPLKQEDIEPPIRYLHYTKYGPPIWVTQGDMKPPPEDDVDQDQGTASGVSTYGSNSWLNQDTEDEDDEPTLPAYAPNNTSVESFGGMSANAPDSHLARAFEDSPAVVADNRPVEGGGDAVAIPAGNHPFLGFGGLPFITAHNRPDQAVMDPSAITADDDPAQAPEWGFDGAGDVKTTRASALAGAGCRVPVKPQRRAKKKASRPSAHLQNETLIYGNGDDAFPIDPALMATRAVLTAENTNSSGAPAPEDYTTNQQNTIRGTNNDTSGTGSRSVNPFGLGSNRTRNAWNPNEKSPQKTLEEYQIPELSRGSCVSYAEDPKVQRQVGKARNGEFKEEGVVWGVRFLVI
ncbi:hypothetical protein D0867_00422 [Hortaea werneckii]|uniref:Uncharacterized protein n=1 Tax=Hortaea werneckii TaxID=91943 RepID=A0A3M7BJP0_HORWE|nr:hypothetical protein D0867_00422 [Hortaea werneckii]RMY39928.1 hypothetical protein D0866_01611 [Hortaea werneckii]